MRCVSCNCNLSDFESTRKYADTNQYVDLCNRCYKTIANQITVTERADLYTETTLEEAYEDDYIFKEDYE